MYYSLSVLSITAGTFPRTPQDSGIDPKNCWQQGGIHIKTAKVCNIIMSHLPYDSVSYSIFYFLYRQFRVCLFERCSFLDMRHIGCELPVRRMNLYKFVHSWLKAVFAVYFSPFRAHHVKLLFSECWLDLSLQCVYGEMGQGVCCYYQAFIFNKRQGALYIIQ